MSITTYAELQTAVARWLKRDDLTAYIPDYIAFGENRLWYGDKGQFPTDPLRSRANEGSETGTLDTASPIVPFNKTDSSYYLGTISLTFTSGGTTWALRYLSPQNFNNVSLEGSSPQYYTFKDGVINLAPSAAGPWAHSFYKKSLPLSASSTGLLSYYPELYLYAACIEGALDIGGDTLAARFAARFQGRLNAINTAQKASPAGGSLAVTIGR